MPQGDWVELKRADAPGQDRGGKAFLLHVPSGTTITPTEKTDVCLLRPMPNTAAPVRIAGAFEDFCVSLGAVKLHHS